MKIVKESLFWGYFLGYVGGSAAPGPKGAPRGPQEAPKRPPRAPKMPPRGPQEAPKRPPRGPKRSPRGPKKPARRLQPKATQDSHNIAATYGRMDTSDSRLSHVCRLPGEQRLHLYGGSGILVRLALKPFLKHMLHDFNVCLHPSLLTTADPQCMGVAGDAPQALSIRPPLGRP